MRLRKTLYPDGVPDVTARLYDIPRAAQIVAPPRLRDTNERQHPILMDTLTPQECAICVLIADGKTNTEIASTLCIAHGTARNYVSVIMSKHHLPNRAAIAVYATVNDLRGAVVADYERAPVSYNPDCYREFAFLAYA